MRPGTIARGREPRAPTVYTVLAASARSHSRRYLAVEALLAGMAAALAGLGGLAVTAIWGTAPGPYGMCHDPDGSSYACDARGNRRPVSPPRG